MKSAHEFVKYQTLPDAKVRIDVHQNTGCKVRIDVHQKTVNRLLSFARLLQVMVVAVTGAKLRLRVG
jgi:hypothetical protein